MAGFGWTYLSREALRRAEAHLSGAAEDVRDEVGFLLVHQRYADRFFPGTSVLHTRLRYALFVPWIYQGLWFSPPKGDFGRALAELETSLVGRLKAANEDGVIGGRLYPKHAAQPPSTVYWTALGTWGVLRSVDARCGPPSRAQVHQMIRRGLRPSRDDDGRPLQDADFPFTGLPPLPHDWKGDGPLSFSLPPKEREFLRDRLVAVRSQAHPQRSSLLARLAERPIALPDEAWDEPVLHLAGEDRDALRRAGQAAALGAVGRALYAALLESRVQRNDSKVSHAARLREVVDASGPRARLLDLAAMAEDIGLLPSVVQRVLSETCAWLRDDGRDPEPLFDAYRTAEEARKGTRARLPNTLDGARRRSEWDPDSHPAPTELHYRWGRVSGLLQDLYG